MSAAFLFGIRSVRSLPDIAASPCHLRPACAKTLARPTGRVTGAGASVWRAPKIMPQAVTDTRQTDG